MTANAALMVGLVSRQQAFQEALADTNVSMLFADDCAEARRILVEHPEVRVVLSNLTLPDGNWWSIHKELQRRARHTALIVVLPREGQDVREILGHGAFAVVAPPFRQTEIAPLVRAATRLQDAGAASAQPMAECVVA